MPSFRFQWLSSARPWSVSASGIAPSVRVQPCGSTANPWLWLVISTTPGREVLHGLVHAPMPEPHLVRPAAERQPEQLMPQADPEDRHLAEQPADRRDAVGGGRRVARPVRQEDAVEAARRDLGRRRLRGEHRRLAPHRREAPQDVPLHAEVVGGDAEHGAVRRVRRPDQRPRPRTAAAADTVFARSAPSMPATPAPGRRATRRPDRAVEIAARIAPWSRSRNVRRRVSIPSIPTTSRPRSSSVRLPSARQLDVLRDASRTTNPAPARGPIRRRRGSPRSSPAGEPSSRRSVPRTRDPSAPPGSRPSRC